MLKYAIGLDISSKDMHACFGTIDALQKVVFKASRKFSNQEDGFTMLELWLLKLYKEKDVPLIICMEATGVYYEKCALGWRKSCSLAMCESRLVPNNHCKYPVGEIHAAGGNVIKASGFTGCGKFVTRLAQVLCAGYVREQTCAQIIIAKIPLVKYVLQVVMLLRLQVSVLIMEH